MVNFSTNVIYKIKHITNSDLFYIGSTTNYERRMMQHKQSVNNINSPDYNSRKARVIRENGGWDCFKHEIIKSYPCKNATEAYMYEQQVMNELNLNYLMNRNKAYLTPTERVNYSSTQAKAWRQRHNIVNCVCGGCYHVNNKARHIKKSKKHLDYSNSSDDTAEQAKRINDLIISESTDSSDSSSSSDSETSEKLRITILSETSESE